MSVVFTPVLRFKDIKSRWDRVRLVQGVMLTLGTGRTGGLVDFGELIEALPFVSPVEVMGTVKALYEDGKISLIVNHQGKTTYAGLKREYR